jgi:hypothetical protein
VAYNIRQGVDTVRVASVVIPRLTAWLSEEVNVFSTRRLATVAKHFTGDPGALEELGEVLDAARADGCGIEIARCLQALELCSPTIDEAWAGEREERCRELGAIDSRR